MNLWKMNEFLEYIPVFDVDPRHILDEIISKAKIYLPENQLDWITKAYDFAREAHKEDKRHSWERYIVHPVKVANILMDIKPDLASIQTALLHDVIEDTPTSYDEVKGVFWEEVANLCKGLEKVSKIKYKWEERQIETLKKTFIAMAKDLRVIFIKLADRIHNVQTLQYHPKIEKRIKIAKETMEIYVSIAQKLWLYNYQLYLENASFKILHEEEFNKIFQHLKKSFGTEKKYKNKWIKLIAEILKKEWIKDFKIEWRLKSPRRIHKKMTNKYQSPDISNVMDLLAYRVITKNVSDCYMILWVIHKYYTPLIKKIKDYIAIPKFNWYRSIHTTILWIFRFPTEIQIRTYEMDEIAKYWVAAHFEYTESGNKLVEASQSKRIKKIQELIETYKTTDIKENFKDKLNIEVLEKNLFIYTPQWDVVELQLWSSVLDFAFRIHSNIGLRYKNALVNWEIKPISYMPKTWDLIEIKTFKNKFSANRHRLEFLHTSNARQQLNRHIKQTHKQEIMKEAIKNLNKKLEKFNLPLYASSEDKIKMYFEERDFEKKIFEILEKKSTYSKLIREIYPNIRQKYINKENKKSNINLINNKSIKENLKESLVIVDQDKHINYKLCQECNPIFWDQIIAKTGKNWIIIHNIKCKALKIVAFTKLLEAHRKNTQIEFYKLLLILKTKDKFKNIINIMTLFSDLNINVLQISIEETQEKKNKISLELQFENPAKIDYLLNDLKKYKDSIEVLRKRFIF